MTGHPAPPEAELVRLAREGEVSAFERLYRDNVGRVYALCLRMAADPVRAEELTQATFVRGWEKLASFRGDSALSSWLHRLAVNIVISEQRTRRRREERFVPSEEPGSRGPGIESEDPGTGIDLERAVAALPQKARHVFVLHDVEGYRHEEIAAFTGTAVGTSKAHLHRARTLLRKALQ